MTTWCKPVRRLLLATLLISAGGVRRAEADGLPQGLNPTVAFADHVQREYGMDDGLPSAWIHELLQTRDGYLWVGTQNGIARYDGQQFRVFNRASTPQLPSNDVRVMFEDRRGTVWIGTIGGLTRYQSGHPGRFEEVPEFSGHSVHAIMQDREGALRIGTHDDTWISQDGNSFQPEPNTPGDVRAFCEDADGRLWIGSRFGLYVRSAILEKISHPRLPDPSPTDNGIPSAGINDLLADRHGNVWIAANRGLLCIRDGKFVSAGKEVGQRSVSDLLETRNGDIYAATRHGVIRSVDGAPFERVLQAEIPRCLLEDREGCFWVGYTVNGALRCYRNADTRTILADQWIRCIREDPPGQLWLGSRDGLCRLQNGQLQRFGTEDGLPHNQINAFSTASSGGFWISTQRGLVRWSGTQPAQVPMPQALTGVNIGNIMEDQSGTLWVAMRGRGAYRVQNGEATRLTVLDHGGTKWFWQAPTQTVLIGHEYGLYEFSDGELRQISDPEFAKLNSSHFVCHYPAADGSLWIGTSGGILRYADGRFRAFTSRDGLGGDYVDRIGVDAQGNLWTGGNAGFFSVPMRELDEFLNGQRTSVSSRRAEQLRGAAIGTFHPSTWRASDGTLWLSGHRGVIGVSSEPVPSSAVAPIVQIEDVQIDGVTTDSSDFAEFQSGHHRLAIRFAAPIFHNPARATVQYRLDGFDEQWVDADDERTAYYTDLRPGDYQFHVRADNGDGAVGRLTQSLAIQVRPRWWETVWFLPAASLALIGLTLAGSWRYVRHVRRRNNELRKLIRQRALAESELRSSEVRFRELAESTQAIPWEADPVTLRFTFIGKQAGDVLGYPAEDWLQPDFWVEHLHPEDRLDAIAYCQHATERCVSHQFEYRMLSADGATIWFHDVVHVVADNGVAVKLRGFMIDVTARRAAEENAQAWQRQLTRMDRVASMGEMATSIAHEVKQPLFAIVSNAQTATRLLNTDEPDIAEIREALMDIASDGNRASDIIDRIRARVRQGTRTLELLDLNEVAMEAVRFIVPELRRRGLQLTTDFARELPTVAGDSVELQQVILNLIINAAQAMRDSTSEHCELTIRTSALDSQVELAVEDQGRGFGDHDPAALFEPFFTSRPGGTGMGLAINRTIIEAHGGRISAAANPVRGATFHFSLPVCREMAAK